MIYGEMLMKTSKRVQYAPYQIAKMSEAEIRKAYSELRSIANKRIQRMNKAGLNITDRKKFATITQINESSKWNVESQLAAVSKYLQAGTTITEARSQVRKFQERMTNMGYGDLVGSTEDAIKAMRYLDDVREQYSDKIFDSGEAMDVYQQTERLKIPVKKVIQNFEKFYENKEKLENMDTPKSKKMKTYKEVDAIIDSFK